MSCSDGAGTRIGLRWGPRANETWRKLTDGASGVGALIGMPDESRLPEGPRRGLVAAVHALYTDAGRPGLRALAAAIRRDDDAPATVSHETIAALLHGRAIPEWGRLASVVRALAAASVHRPDVNETVVRFHELWRLERDAHRPSTLAPNPAGPEHAEPETETERATAPTRDEPVTTWAPTPREYARAITRSASGPGVGIPYPAHPDRVMTKDELLALLDEIGKSQAAAHRREQDLTTRLTEALRATAEADARASATRTDFDRRLARAHETAASAARDNEELRAKLATATRVAATAARENEELRTKLAQAVQAAAAVTAREDEELRTKPPRSGRAAVPYVAPLPAPAAPEPNTATPRTHAPRPAPTNPWADPPARAAATPTDRPAGAFGLPIQATDRSPGGQTPSPAPRDTPFTPFWFSVPHVLFLTDNLGKTLRTRLQPDTWYLAAARADTPAAAYGHGEAVVVTDETGRHLGTLPSTYGINRASDTR